MSPGFLSPALWAHVERYGESHRHPVNRVLHFIGIPALLVSALGLLSYVAITAHVGGVPVRFDMAWPALLFALVWYLVMGWKAGLPSFLLFVGCYFVGSWLSLGMLSGLLVVGVIAHVVGHYGFEGKPPSVLSNPAAVLEAPTWLLSLGAGVYR